MYVCVCAFVSLLILTPSLKVRFKFSERFGVEHAQEIVTSMGLAQVPAWELPNLIPHEMIELYPREFIDGANIIRLR